MPHKPRFSKEQMIDAIDDSKSIYDVIVKLGLKTTSGSSQGTVKKYAEKYRLSLPNYNYSHLKKVNLRNTTPNSKIFCVNSKFNHHKRIKTLLFEMGVPNKCILCGLGTVWNGQQLSLQLDHINGISTDNRIENLRILCPNCHSQTETYAGRKPRKGLPPYPADDILLAEVALLGVAKVANKYQRNDSTIRHRIRKIKQSF